MAWDPILNARYAKYGVGTPSTTFPGITRVAMNWNEETRTSRGGDSELPDDVFVLGGVPEVLLESEDYGAIVTIMRAARVKNALLIGFRTGAGNKKQAFGAVKFVRPGNSELPPREGGGRVPLYQIIAQCVKSADEDTWSDVIGPVEDDT